MSTFVPRVIRGVASFLFALGLFTLSFPAERAAANLITDTTLTDNGSTATINSASVFSGWNIGPASELNQQQFFYRLGSTGGQSALNQLNVVSQSSSSNQLDVVYGGSGFTIETRYSLMGSNNNGSDMSIQIKVANTSASSKSFHLYQYLDFNLGDMTVNQQAALKTDPDSGTTYMEQTNQATGCLVDLVSDRPPPATEVDLTTDPTNSLLMRLSSGTIPATLTNNASSNSFLGDVAWAYQWDMTLAAGRSVVFSEDQNIAETTGVQIPEPATLGFLALGSIALALPYLRRRRRIPAAV
jgi:hypothetical protein